MDKMFKRTLLGAAVAMAAVGVQAAQLTDNVQLYGQAAGNLYFESKGDSAKDDTVGVEIESRIGLRGTQSFNNFGLILYGKSKHQMLTMVIQAVNLVVVILIWVWLLMA